MRDLYRVYSGVGIVPRESVARYIVGAGRTLFLVSFPLFRVLNTDQGN